MNGSRGEDEGAPGVFTYREGLIEGPGEGVEIGGVRGGRGCFVSDGQGDGAMRVDSSREAKGEEAVRFVEDASGNVRKGRGNCESVWVRGRGLVRSKEGALGTWKGGRPLFDWRGDRARDLLGGRRLPSFPFALASRA